MRNFHADHGRAEAQMRYGLVMLRCEDGSVDLISAAHYFKLSADQGNADGQFL
jgi:TPR repeat protein